MIAHSLYRYADTTQLATALCERISTSLHHALTRAPSASLVLPGGGTPVELMRHLTRVPLAWERVLVTLSDERLVGDADPRSNACLVHEHLLQGEAARARFIPLDHGTRDPQLAAELAARALAAMVRPFDVVLLGMGADGHTASLFPGCPLLAQQPHAGEPTCAAVAAPAPPNVAVPRVTLLPAALTDARSLLVAITGEAKLRLIEQALRGGPVTQLPIRLALNQSRVPCHVYWSP